MGEKELRASLEEEGKIEVECHFCEKKYTFSKEEIENLIGAARD